MKLFVTWAFALLLVFAFITAVPGGYAGDQAQKSPPLPFQEGDFLPAALQASAAGAGAEPIVLAAARNLPDGSSKPKKARKAKGPAEGSGCQDGKLLAGTGADVEIITPCKVVAGTYNYGFVNIHTGGSLNFDDATIDFWAKSILVENEGSLIVGSATDPIGNSNRPNVVTDNIVTFHLYGDDSQAFGITCKTPNCGVPGSAWTSDPKKEIDLPGGITDLFYKYETLPADEKLTSDSNSYFGLKTLAVSYGGSLQMFGRKGAEYLDFNPKDDPPGMQSGDSWVRLNKTVPTGETVLVLDRTVDWQAGDWIVVTTTDFIPNHSEMRQIDNAKTVGDHTEITLKTALSYPHNGEKYELTKNHHIPDRLNNLGEEFMTSVDTRAAVALLTRSIRIVSEGAGFNEPLPAESDSSTGRYFGGHVITRQGFKQFQMKGVELKQLGQGGRMAHSPVNFHMARTVPSTGMANATFVTACSVNESMTRMVEIRGTQGVTLKRNVGYKSIGHGYYLAEGTETDNHLEANIGIYARPAVRYRDNPRQVPGVLASWHSGYGTYRSDYVHPSVFYIANGYNTFQDNMAVGAGTCGACYWIAPVINSGLSKTQSWKKYATIQKITPGAAPLFRFHGNFCSTAMYSLITIDSPGVCAGVSDPPPPPFPDTKTEFLRAILSPFEQEYSNKDLYPIFSAQPLSGAVTGNLQAATCGNETDCSANTCVKGKTKNCAVNVIDSYTSSFHWAAQNYSAIWLRTNWFLFTNSALTDVLNGGLTMVSGGSWDQVINRYWALTRKSVFIGSTQKDEANVWAQNWGPVNPETIGKSVCMSGTRNAFCRVQDAQGNDEGIVIPRENFSVYQRLYNIYDGPVYQESNAYVNIKKRAITGCGGGQCGSAASNFMYWQTPGILKATEEPHKGECIMPNAAIGWKQPNGFYYPPAFHSKNLFFDDVDIRHFVIVPLFKPGTFEVDETAVTNNYCTYPGIHKDLFDKQFTDIDRQTELNDDDGSLSGLKGAVPQQITETSGSISVNKDQFYYAPTTPFECLSEQSCYQSPYDYVSAVVFPDNASLHSPPNWFDDCTDYNCYGVPLYRQHLNTHETAGVAQGIKMLGAATYQRSTMVANKGIYYIDTAASAARQRGATPRTHLNVFTAGRKYNFFLIYAKPNTEVTFQLYVGKAPAVNFNLDTAVQLVRAGTNRFIQNGHNHNFDDATVLVNPVIHEPQSWPPASSEWTKYYHSDTGILEVTMNLANFMHEFDLAKEESCGPPSFCQWNKDGNDGAGACRCAAHDDKKNPNPIGYACDNASDICAWSSLRSECPSGGCYGFQVEFPAGFVADDDNVSDSAPPIHRPAPTAFPADWTITEWEKASQDLSLDEAWKSGHYDPVVYPQGPCFYSSDETIPGNAALPTSSTLGKKRK